MSKINSPAVRASTFVVIVIAIQVIDALATTYGWSKFGVRGIGVLLSIAEVVLVVGSMSSLERMIKELSVHLTRMSRLDLKGQIYTGGWGPSLDALRALDKLQVTLRETVGEIRSASEEVSTASAEIAIGNQDLSQRTEQTSSNLQRTASSLTRLTDDVRESAESASQANDLASTATQVALRGAR